MLTSGGKTTTEHKYSVTSGIKHSWRMQNNSQPPAKQSDNCF